MGTPSKSHLVPLTVMSGEGFRGVESPSFKSRPLDVVIGIRMMRTRRGVGTCFNKSTYRAGVIFSDITCSVVMPCSAASASVSRNSTIASLSLVKSASPRLTLTLAYSRSTPLSLPSCERS